MSDNDQTSEQELHEGGGEGGASSSVVEKETDELFLISTPVNINRHNLTYTILPEEYSVIEDNSDSWNPDEAFSESIQLDESVNGLSSSASSSSSSSSISYLLVMAQQMIANYPSEEQLAGMIAENYLNYIAELCQEQPQEEAAAAVGQTSDANDDSVILLESKSAQTSFSFEQQQQQEEEEEEDNVEDMEH